MLRGGRRRLKDDEGRSAVTLRRAAAADPPSLKATHSVTQSPA
jgi:hypothetical protein